MPNLPDSKTRSTSSSPGCLNNVTRFWRVEFGGGILELVWITLILSDITQFSSLSFQNAWVPQKILCLAWFWVLVSSTQNSKIWVWAMEFENNIWVFSKTENWFSVDGVHSFVKKLSYWNEICNWVFKPNKCFAIFESMWDLS